MECPMCHIILTINRVKDRKLDWQYIVWCIKKNEDEQDKRKREKGIRMKGMKEERNGGGE